MFVLNHKAGSENCTADALSRRVALLSTSQVEVTGFQRIKEDYNDCPDFGNIYTNLTSHRSHGEYILQEGYLVETDPRPPFCNKDRLLAVDRRQTTVDRHSGRPMLQQRSTVDGSRVKRKSLQSQDFFAFRSIF